MSESNSGRACLVDTEKDIMGENVLLFFFLGGREGECGKCAVWILQRGCIGARVLNKKRSRSLE